jgi:hypothetical protein
LKLEEMTNCRRTVYGRVDRYDLDDMLRLHDFPDPLAHSPGREPTTTAVQQLFVLNSPLLQTQAKALAERIQAERPNGVPSQIQRAYRLLFGRGATEAELQLGSEFLGKTPTPEIWQQYAQALLASNEFLFVD